MAGSVRERLIEAAVDVFSREGFRAAGIDEVLRAAGVAKMSLYNNFGGKDDLIVAALRRRDEDFRLRLSREVGRRASTSRDRLLVVFDIIEEWIASAEFNGCMFINAVAEHAEPAASVRRAAAEHKRLMHEYLAGLARDAGAGDPEDLASRLQLVIEGRVVNAQVDDTDRSGSSSIVRSMAGDVIDRALESE